MGNGDTTDKASLPDPEVPASLPSPTLATNNQRGSLLWSYQNNYRLHPINLRTGVGILPLVWNESPPDGASPRNILRQVRNYARSSVNQNPAGIPHEDGNGMVSVVG